MGALARHRAAALLALLMVAGAVAAQVAADRDRTRSEGPALSSRDAGGSGALGLSLWLQRLGYQVRQVEGTQSVPDDSIDVLLVLRPTQRFDQDQIRSLRAWLDEGGVLVYLPGFIASAAAIPPLSGDGLSDIIEVGRRIGPLAERGEAALPFFTVPPAAEFALRSDAALELWNDAWVPLIVGGGRTFAATRQYGSGRVYALGAEALLANDGVAHLDNPALLLNILERYPAARSIGFDEYHHGVISAPDFFDAARSSPWGWAIAYASVATFGFAVWGGRRFGPPVVPVRSPARSTGDYVTAFSGLLQRARAANWAQAHYAQLIRRGLARSHGIRADLPATSLASLLAARRAFDSDALAEHLTVLDGRPVGERALLGRVRSVERILRTLRIREVVR